MKVNKKKVGDGKAWGLADGAVFLIQMCNFTLRSV